MTATRPSGPPRPSASPAPSSTRSAASSSSATASTCPTAGRCTAGASSTSTSCWRAVWDSLGVVGDARRRRLRPGRRHDARCPLLPRRAAEPRREPAGRSGGRQRSGHRLRARGRPAAHARRGRSSGPAVAATAAALRAAGVGRGRPGGGLDAERARDGRRLPGHQRHRRGLLVDLGRLRRRPAWSTASARSSRRCCSRPTATSTAASASTASAGWPRSSAGLPTAASTWWSSATSPTSPTSGGGPASGPSPTSSPAPDDAALGPPAFERLPFDHPAAILYSSGTTGVPEVHRPPRRRPAAEAPQRAPAALRRPAGRPRLLLHDLRLDDVELAGVGAGRRRPRSCCSTAARSTPAPRRCSTWPSATR